MFKKTISFFLSKLGYKLEYLRPGLSADMDSDFEEIYRECSPYTMTSIEKMYALYEAVKYVVGRGIKGDFVEAGVWRGGSTMLAAQSFKKFGDLSRKFYLYDTFEGMPEPESIDETISGKISAKKIWDRLKDHKDERWMCYSPIEETEKNIFRTGYPKDNFTFVKGKVEDTIPKTSPTNISILRIDTDWYSSTYHVLENFYPKLSSGGLLILDDYGYWRGAREAVSRYFAKKKIRMLLNRIDGAGRIGIKN